MDTPITIKVIDHDIENLVLVDLPGIVANEQEQDVISMIEKYITPKENMILAITRASQGDDTARVLELARKYDPEEKRTLRILTKYELFGSPGHAQAVSVQFALSESRN